MFTRKFSRIQDGIPRHHGIYYIDWLKLPDLPQIAKLEKTFFPEPLSLFQLIKLSLMPITYYIVIRKEQKVAAYIGFQMYGPAAHTISMAVHPEHRRQGLAVLVQKSADRVAANRGRRWFTGEVRVSNVAQLKFLEGLGWQEVGICSQFFKNGEDAVVVWNWL